MGPRDSRSIQFGSDRLTEALEQIPDTAWSLPSTFGETGVHHGYRRVVLVSAGQWQPHAELFAFVWDAMSPVADAWLSSIEPGGFIVPHCDGGPWKERWQIPIRAQGHWHGEAAAFAPISGEAFPVEHWKPHAVTNRSSEPRIHLVVDRNVPVNREPKPFALMPAPADMADLIERTQP